VAQHFSQILFETGESHMHNLTFALDWSDIVIGPSGLLLVILNLLMSQVHVSGGEAWNQPINNFG
jgi:hypothetical protein